MDGLRIPITSELDLHTFRPKEIPSLLDDYIEACIGKRIGVVRIIHGKGSGILKKRVQSILKKHPKVFQMRDSTSLSGGWGVTVVELKLDE